MFKRNDKARFTKAARDYHARTNNGDIGNIPIGAIVNIESDEREDGKVHINWQCEAGWFACPARLLEPIKSTHYHCPFHHKDVKKGKPCPECIEDYKYLPDVSTMTREERLAEFERWEGVLTIPFHDVHVRLEALVGRPIFIHELGTVGCVGLKDEIMGYEVHPDDNEIVRRLEVGYPDIEIIPVNLDDFEDTDE